VIGIIDYGLGNVRAFANIYSDLGVPFTVATAPGDLDGISRAILPGVGAFDQAMMRLDQSGMKERLEELVTERSMPVLGICVGMQILAASSAEGVMPGFGWINAEVVGLEQAVGQRRIPHMGWNDVRPLRTGGLFEGLPEPRFYFLHSYVMQCHRRQDVLAVTDYGGEFACAVHRDNVYGVQFHPEKSHHDGIRLLRNFSGL